MPRSLSKFQTAALVFTFGVITFAASVTVAAIVSEQPDQFLFTFEPDPLPITGPVTVDGVPITGKTCFSSDTVFTVTSETWSFTLGPSAAPPGFRPWYVIPQTTFPFAPDGRALDANNCRVFLDLPQVPPAELTADLLEYCDVEPSMSFILNAEAIDVHTGRRSEAVFVQSNDFTFPARC